MHAFAPFRSERSLCYESVPVAVTGVRGGSDW